MDRQPTWTDFYEAEDYFVPNMCSPRDLVARPDNIEKLYHTHTHTYMIKILQKSASPEPLDCFEESCYVAIGTSAYHSLFKC